MTLIFLTSDGLWYREKTEDPWFAASQEVPTYGDSKYTDFVYFSDETAGVLGCASQIWICNPERPESSCLNIQTASESFYSDMWPDSFERAAMVGFMTAFEMFFVNPDTLYASPGLPTLLSRFTLFGPTQLDAIPPNRWQKEIEYTFQASIASLQTGLAAAAQKGAPWPTDEKWCPTPEACQALCYHQVSR